MSYNINDIHTIKIEGQPYKIVANNTTPERTDAMLIKANTTFNSSNQDMLHMSQKALDSILEALGDEVEIITKEQVEKNLKEFEAMELMK